MNRKVYLEGELGNKFGKEFTMNANSFVDVFRCLECNYPEIRQYLIECDEKNVGFVCEVAGTPLESEKELLLQYSTGDMVITPLPAGSKSGGGKLLAALAIVALIIINPGNAFYTKELAAVGTGTGAQGATFAYTLTGKGLVAASLAANLALTGINQIMAPDPSVDADQDESYLFQGTGQTLIEGDPVPVLYGQLRVPGRPISTQVRSEKQAFYDAGVNLIVSNDPVTGGYPTITGITVPSAISEGASGTITVNTSNIADGTTLYWNIIARSEGVDVENDFAENTDSFTISSNTGSFSVQPVSDSLTEGTESFAVRVYGGQTGKATDSATINITDSSTGSTPNPDKEITSISSDVSSVDEGDTVTFTISTSGISNGTRLNYYVTQASTYGQVSTDFGSYQGEVTIGNDVGYVFITPDEDLTTEGSEAFQLVVEGEDVESKISSSVTVNDTSLTPSETPPDEESDQNDEQDDDRADEEESIPNPGVPPRTTPEPTIPV